MPDDVRALSRPVPACRLTQFQPAETQSSLLGWAAVSFPGGWRVASIPVFRNSVGTLSVGVPSIPLLDQASAPLRDQQGKKRCSALAAAGVGGAP